MPQCKKCGMIFMNYELDRFGHCENCADKRKRTSVVVSRSSSKVCARCGDHGLFLYIDPEGYCENCRPKVDAERKAQRRTERLAQDYQSCQNGTARPGAQRIYNAFRAKYPDALITGIEAKDNDTRMVVHLDGGDKYSVVFNALTNDVDVTKIDEPSGNQISSPPPVEPKRSGCVAVFLKAVLMVVGVYFAIAILIALLTGDSSKSSSTPKVTAAPTATALSGDLDSWANYYAFCSLPDNTKLGIVFCTRYTDDLSNVLVTMQMDVMLTRKQYVRSSANFILDFCRQISHRNDVNQVTIICYGPFIDVYGNEKIDTGIRAVYSLDTLKAINYDYFADRLYSSPLGIVEAADEYSINHLYLEQD